MDHKFAPRCTGGKTADRRFQPLPSAGLNYRVRFVTDSNLLPCGMNGTQHVDSKAASDSEGSWIKSRHLTGHSSVLRKQIQDSISKHAKEVRSVVPPCTVNILLMHACTFACTQVWMYARTHARTHECMYVCMYVYEGVSKSYRTEPITK